MAFKVESLAELRSIADTMYQYAENAENESNKIVNAIEELDANISGQGVDEALTKLKDNLTGNATDVASTLKYVCLFIKSQAASYSSNEESTSSSLNNVQNALNNIDI